MVSGFVTLIIFILALGGMIFIHELGHYLAARWAKVDVEEFGFGLPSYKLATLFKWQGTEFTIHALPLGGFVRLKGENDPTIPGGFGTANPWKRLVILFAGPLMNLLTAAIVFSSLIAWEGIPVRGAVQISTVSENSPAQEAGLLDGDVLLAINGQNVEDIQPAIDIIRGNLDKPVELLIERDGKQMTITATPLSSRPKEQGALGVGLGYDSYETRPATFTEIITGGPAMTAFQSVTILYIPVALIRGVIAPEEARVVGFKGIYDMFDVAVEEDVASRQEASSAPVNAPAPQPTNWTLNLIAVLSVSLGVMNLLPIPALDGGRILFTLPEILFKKRIPADWENMVNGVAMLLLIGLMLFVNVMDVLNPVQIPTP